jgi:hypothetical protein
MTLTARLPVDLADDLVLESLADPALAARAGPVLTASLDLIGLAANLGTILISAEAVPEVCRRIHSWVRREHLPGPSPAHKVAIRVVTATGRTTEIIIEGLPAERVEDLVTRALAASDGEG